MIVLLQGSQLPRRLTGDARERIGEIPIVPIHHPAKPPRGERAWANQQGETTLLSLTLARLCDSTEEEQRKWELWRP